ncbi:DegT/DnrJ/EryC1/StrS aminotransferase family protein [Notoacmeibacter sp. MSK16QG-6]|uniref:DegT/DnrJ/EryC1/StrS family aminotransferase n=1 Tax=Notoacmeibacter sp. MSK16QG-6 TaxID=2957982 RepID=UPI00209E912C|nr:DegT/DnrJ/EryC1/StrS aminotransferase family protein [Notoacmeibacter sp. MSK16QG-6]MCP1198189.1 DegT/DnrJ/EryC1/StrS aminotransferase family protein [Notoacmeibacter sp. MSK16QG-6]
MLPFIDLAAQQARLRDRIDAAIGEVLDGGAYILGPAVGRFEDELSAFCGARHSISCANGTDALLLALMALEVTAGDAVFVPSFTFAATAEIVPCLGAVPYFVDIDPQTYNMDPESLKRCIEKAARDGMPLKAVIPVDLFGLPADIDAIEPIARESGMAIVCDTAQGFGGKYKGRVAGAMGDLATTSFFPAKPLGCYGDGGAITTNDEKLADSLRSLRNHGAGADKYDNIHIGMNSRLDSIQAAILSVKLSIFEEEITMRQDVAARYVERLADVVAVPTVPEGLTSTWAQYTVRLPVGADRSAVQAKLRDAGVPTAIYYPIPLHRQTAYRHWPHDPSGMVATDEAAESVLALPMHPYLEAGDQDRIAEALKGALAA